MWAGIAILCFTSNACQQDNLEYSAEINRAEYMHRSMDRLTQTIVHNIFSPPVASRVYVYPSIAAYEALQPSDPNYNSLAGQLNGLPNAPQPQADQEYCFPLSALHAFLEVGKIMTVSDDSMLVYQDQLYQELEDIRMPRAVWERSIVYGQAVADHILTWASEDQYKQTRTFPKFTITDEPGRWQPTPPGYLDGIEPHWRDIRPMVLDSAGQFPPPPPTPFSTEPGSQFMVETQEVYEALQEGPAYEERVAIAEFWDCNPFVSHHLGHVMYATKKITPGGHWIGITKIACQQSEADLMETVEAYALVSIALFDGFISCWDEKYRSNLIRPEAVINQHIDEDWLPALQTPPFPEHTSGHSVISRSAAVTLTSLFGKDFAFLDTTEEAYGLPARQFKSFLQASEEAAVSRLYGGIHYRPAIDYGVAQGEQVGNFVVQQVQTRAQLGERE